MVGRKKIVEDDEESVNLSDIERELTDRNISQSLIDSPADAGTSHFISIQTKALLVEGKRGITPSMII